MSTGRIREEGGDPDRGEGRLNRNLSDVVVPRRRDRDSRGKVEGETRVDTDQGAGDESEGREDSWTPTSSPESCLLMGNDRTLWSVIKSTKKHGKGGSDRQAPVGEE